jgi:hypothetical protein
MFRKITLERVVLTSPRNTSSEKISIAPAASRRAEEPGAARFARSYDVDVLSMHLYLHVRGIHDRAGLLQRLKRLLRCRVPLCRIGELVGIGFHRNAGSLVGHGRATRPRKPDSGHTGTISITLRARRAGRNVMKPRIQCVLAQ